MTLRLGLGKLGWAVPIIVSILIFYSVLALTPPTKVHGELVEVYLLPDILGDLHAVTVDQFIVASLDICPDEHLHADNGSFVVALDLTVLFQPGPGVEPPECGYGLTADIETDFVDVSVCGNNVCDVDENPDSCSADCLPLVCGNNVCDVDENPDSCSADCLPLICGNNVCDVDENPDSCSADCDVIPNNPPDVKITSPLDGARFVSGKTITFTGTASDKEDGPLDSKIEWSFDGFDFGLGPEIMTDLLALGKHKVTASVTDSNGATVETSITIEIVPLIIEITSPADGDTITIGDTITFTGTAADKEDGPLDSKIMWTINGGDFGTRSSFDAKILVLGPISITAKVTNSNGESVETTIEINSVSPKGTADLSVTKEPSVTEIQAGKKFTYKITVKKQRA